MALVSVITTGVRKKCSKHDYFYIAPLTRVSIGSGRMALSLRRRYFGHFQNVLRIILNAYSALGGWAPHPIPQMAGLQRLMFI